MKRLVTGSLVGCFWLALIFGAPYWLFWATLVAISCVCAAEFVAVLHPHLSGARRIVVVLLGVIPVMAAFSGQLSNVVAGFFLAFFLTVIVNILWWNESRTSLVDLLKGLYLVAGVSLPLAHVVLLRSMDQGHVWVLFAIVIVGASDTAAYYFGSHFGTHLLCPQVSPKKTWEGALAGVIAGGGIAALFIMLLPPYTNVTVLVGAGVLCAVCGMLGDLAESMLKRGAGVKDSGTLLAGHGGFLDRGDALLFAAPILYYLLVMGVL